MLSVVTLAAPANNGGYGKNEVLDTSVPKAGKTPQGGLMLMATDGKPFGFLNAEELTAFRTALASSLLMVRRKRVKTITVFGTGKQAYYPCFVAIYYIANLVSYWHVRLALLFHGATIQHVHIISHRFSEQGRDFFKGFVGLDEEVKEREGW